MSGKWLGDSPSPNPCGGCPNPNQARLDPYLGPTQVLPTQVLGKKIIWGKVVCGIVIGGKVAFPILGKSRLGKSRLGNRHHTNYLTNYRECTARDFPSIPWSLQRLIFHLPSSPGWRSSPGEEFLSM
jgi:hypothetical protein